MRITSARLRVIQGRADDDGRPLLAGTLIREGEWDQDHVTEAIVGRSRHRPDCPTPDRMLPPRLEPLPWRAGCRRSANGGNRRNPPLRRLFSGGSARIFSIRSFSELSAFA